MANVVTVRIKTEPGAAAIKTYANSAALILTGSGGDKWMTDENEGTVARSFTVTVENYPEEAES